MTRRLAALLLVLLAALLAAGVACAGDEAATPASIPTSTAPATEPAPPAPTAPATPISPPPVVPPPSVRFDEPVTMRPGEEVVIESGHLLRFIGVTSDSRCPVDVQCIWAGEATVQLELVDGDVSVRLDVTMPGGGPARIADGALDIEALSLAPEPRSTVAIVPGDYEVTVVVHPLAGPPRSG